jgi:hypothetical protein
MRGSITANEKDRKFSLKPVPVIVDPILNMRQRLTGADRPEPRAEPRMVPVLSGGTP